MENTWSALWSFWSLSSTRRGTLQGAKQSRVERAADAGGTYDFTHVEDDLVWEVVDGCCLECRKGVEVEKRERSRGVVGLLSWMDWRDGEILVGSCWTDSGEGNL